MFKKKDIILILVILVIALAGLVIVKTMQSENGGGVKISVGGKTYGTYDINKDQTIEIDEYGYNKVVIKDKTVHMESADCPDQICVNTGTISSNNEAIICLPHELVVEITVGDDAAVDVITK